jgi:xylulokinase
VNYLMGIDLGTSGVKVILIDTEGRSIYTATESYDMIHPQNGWAEQNPEDWWTATSLCIKKALIGTSLEGNLIGGIGLTGQMHGLVMLDENNEIIRPAIIWCDQRSEKECNEITHIVGKERLIEITANPALAGFTASKIMWVKNNEPDLFAKCRHILLPKDYIRFKLTGQYATDVSDASGMQLLDVKNRCWSKEILNLLEIDESLLGEVFESPDITGEITLQASEQTGLAIGIRVVAGAGDNAAAAVGTGVVTDKTAFTTIGTSGVVFAHTGEYKLDPLGRVHTFCCAVPGAWHIMGVTQAAGLSLKWYWENFCENLKIQTELKGINQYAMMESLAQDVPIGANRLLYLPYLMGERTPHLDSNCRGVFCGLSTVHSNAEMIRAVFEGVTYSLKDCYEILKEMDVRIDSMIASGGGGTSRFWRQMMADVFGCSVVKISNDQGPAYGAALLAGVGTGVYGSVEEACMQTINADEYCDSSTDNHQRYLQVYREYQKVYPALKDVFANLALL